MLIVPQMQRQVEPRQDLDSSSSGECSARWLSRSREAVSDMITRPYGFRGRLYLLFVVESGQASKRKVGGDFYAYGPGACDSADVRRKTVCLGRVLAGDAV